MTLLVAEGFERVINRVTFPSNVGVLGATVRYAYGNSYNHNGVGYYMALDIPATDTATIGAAFFSGTYAAESNLGGFTFMADSASLGHIRVYSTGATNITVARGGFNSAGTVLATGTVPTFLNVWRYVEAQVKISDSSGQVIVRVDGVEVINFTGDTRNGGTSTNVDRIICGPFSNSNGYIDDVYVTDKLGSRNIGFLGEVRVYESQPGAAGSSTQFTPSSGANYAAVADTSDSTYVSDSVTGHRDTYNTVDLPSISGVIAAVVLNTRAGKTDVGPALIKPVIKSASTLTYGTTRTLASSPAQYTDIFEFDPNTSGTWTASGVNAMEIGVEVG